jgi:hypothetical protein
MINTLDLHPQFITDEKGIKQSVILSMQVFQDLLEDMEDLVTIAERKDELTTSHTELLKELQASGLLCFNSL